MNHYRTFKPVILFHDYSYSTDASGVTHHIHIPYGDPYYSPLIQQKKQTVGTMLKSNGKAWYEIIQNTRQELSPKPTPPKTIQNKKKQPKAYFVSEEESSEEDFVHLSKHGDYSSSSSSSSSSSGSETEEHPLKSSIPSVDNHIMIRKRRGNLPKTVTAVLKQWLVEHCRNPYPIEAEKTSLKDKTGLTLNQISNWFINARRRLLPQILDSANDKEHPVLSEAIEDDPIPIITKRKRSNKLDYLCEEDSNPILPTPTVMRKRRRYKKRMIQAA